MTDTGVSYFDIDFEKNPKLAEEQLRYLAALSLSYITAFSDSVKEPHNFVFIAKPFGESMKSGKFIFGFDHRGVYSSDLIYSLKKLHTESSEVNYYKVENLNDVGVFDLAKSLKRFGKSAFIPVNAQDFLNTYAFSSILSDMQQYFDNQ